MAFSHTNIQLARIYFEDSMLTYNLHSSVTAADVGKPVELMTGVNGTVRVATDGKAIHGFLQSFEDRTVEGTKLGTVGRRFAQRWPVKASDALAVGDIAVGAGGGEVRKAVSGDNLPAYGANVVVEVADGLAVVHKI